MISRVIITIDDWRADKYRWFNEGVTQLPQKNQSLKYLHFQRHAYQLLTDKTVTLIHYALWTECFTTLATTLSARYPDKAPHLMAYLRTIVRASRNFEGSAWASYDAAYRRQAANNRSLDWAIPDLALYNEAFTGRARVIPRCQFCLSDSHSSHDCIFGPEDFRHYQNRQLSPRRGAVRTHTAQICRLFNQPGGSQCRFKQCRYAHLCARCNQPHPVSECDRRQSHRPRSTSPTGKERET